MKNIFFLMLMVTFPMAIGSNSNKIIQSDRISSLISEYQIKDGHIFYVFLDGLIS